MSLICKMRGHQPGAEVWNEGLFFAKCRRCHLDIIHQRSGKWEALPLGVRVAWHPPGHQGVHWSKVISRARAKGEVRAATLPARRQAGDDELG